MSTPINEVIMHFNYVIIFDDALLLDGCESVGANFYKGELSSVINIVWHIMHLPRSTFDIRKPSELAWVINHYNAHNIHFIPKSRIDSFVDNHREVETEIIFCEDSCYNEAIYLNKIKESIGVFCASMLSDSTIKKHWDIICEKYSSWPGAENRIDESARLVTRDYYQALPLLFNEHNLYASKDLFDKYETKFNTFSKIAFEQICLRANIEANIEHSKDETINTKQSFEINMSKMRVPITLVQSSISPFLAKKNPETSLYTQREDEILKVMSAHNALAEGGLIIEIPKCSEEIFRLFNEIELDCKNQTENPKKIWRVLKKIGKILYKDFTEEQIKLIHRSSSLVAFTDFPIGIAILPPYTAPLCCYCDITYRHLTPLSFAAIQEFSGYRTIRLTDKCNILMLECLSVGDRVRNKSDELLKPALEEISKQYEKINFFYKEANSIDNFIDSINNSDDIDILLISAHGHYNSKIGYTAIEVGGQLFSDTAKIVNMPPVVLFSACHVSPRGHGSFSISDSFLRKGAVAVLGTLIPVDVRKNAHLMCRLILNVAENQIGRNNYKNLLEAWSSIMASHAVHEICDCHPRIKEWFYGTSQNGPTNEFLFKQVESVSRVTRQNIYEDSISVLRGMLQKQADLLSSFEVNVADEQYFPESLFYEMSGLPENIILKDVKT